MKLYLELPWLVTEFLSIALYISLIKIISSENDIRPWGQKLWHPEHVSTGGVQEPDLILFENLLELVSDGVEHLDHHPRVLMVTSNSTNCFMLVTCLTSLTWIIFLEKIFPIISGLKILKKIVLYVWIHKLVCSLGAFFWLKCCLPACGGPSGCLERSTTTFQSIQSTVLFEASFLISVFASWLKNEMRISYLKYECANLFCVLIKYKKTWNTTTNTKAVNMISRLPFVICDKPMSNCQLLHK